MHQFRSGSGRLSLDYVRTLRHRDSPGPSEEFSDSSALTRWIVQFGPWEHLPEAASEDSLDAARALREAIFRLIEVARSAGALTGAAESDRTAINSAASAPVPTPSLDADGRLQWVSADPVAAVLAMVARDALDLIASPIATRIRRCAGHDCQALFIDLSRPGTRRWCSMNTCGNRAKKTRLSARQSNP